MGRLHRSPPVSGLVRRCQPRVGTKPQHARLALDQLMELVNVTLDHMLANATKERTEPHNGTAAT